MRRVVTLLAIAVMAALAMVAVSGPASAAPAQRPGGGGVGAESVSCGYYSGTIETVFGNSWRHSQAEGNRVREAQCLLIHWGYSVGSSGIDGDFGNNTLNAVTRFQADTYGICGPPGLRSDGKVGPHTWSALRSDNSCPTA